MTRTSTQLITEGSALELSQHKPPPTSGQELGPQDFEAHTTSSKPVCRRQDSFLDKTESDLRTTESRKTPNRFEYMVQANMVYKSSTRHFMWRWLTFFVCTYAWLLRFGQLFLITIPFRSAFSFTALFKPSPIYLKLELDQSTGCLYYNKAFYQDTVISKLRRMWHEIRVSRTAFDATPSKGMLDKAAARPLHRIWSYVFRGLFASMLLLLFWPPMCLLLSMISILIGLSLPLIVPTFSLILHILGLFLWDAYKPASNNNRLFPLFEVLIFQLLIRVVFQLVYCTMCAFVVYPLFALLHFTLAILRYIARSIWDLLVFHLLIKRLARIPSREDFMVRRISGPGSSTNQFYQAHPVDVLIVLTGQLELLELHLWRRQMEVLAEKPLNSYHLLIRSLSWLSVIPQTDGDTYSVLCRHTKNWRTAIESKAEDRTKSLQLDLKPNQLHRIKMSDRDLRVTLQMGAELCQTFYRNRIATRLQLLDQARATWWAVFSLSEDDFLGLCTSLLRGVFGEQIFRSISETDVVFPLQFHDPNLTQPFQDFLRNLVDRGCQTSPIPRRQRPLSVIRPPVEADDLTSVCSDVLASSIEVFSQRGTVIAVHSQAPGPDDNGSRWFLQGGLETAKKRVPDPIAFIHIDLPLLPLSIFAPFTCRMLPKPLQSFPKPPPVLLPGLTRLARRLDRMLHCCVCLTKSEVDEQCSRRLTERWNEKVQLLNAPASNTGLTTLLNEEERHLCRNLKRSSEWKSSPLQEDPLDSVEDVVSRASRLASFSSLGGVLEHLGRVYHPAVITLLMHLRDREHSPLDLTHPAIEAAVRRITMPSREYTLLKRIRNSSWMHSTDTLDDLLNRPVIDSVLSVESGLNRTDSRRDKCQSMVEPDSLLCIRTDLTESRKVHSTQSFSPPAGSTRPPSTVNVGSKFACIDPNRHSRFKATEAERQRLLPESQSGEDWLAGHWSGLETPGCETNGSPTCSLYGTEDAASTEDLGDTEDALSLSSITQCNLLNRSGALPLAIPELLTTSATTAGSGSADSENELPGDVVQTPTSPYDRSPSAPSTITSPGSCFDLFPSGDEAVQGTPKPMIGRVVTSSDGEDMKRNGVCGDDGQHSVPDSTVPEEENQEKQLSGEDFTKGVPIV